MGSSMSRIYDDMEEKQWDEDKNWLETLSAEIKNINPSTKEFRDLKWIEKNKEKILRNWQLIEILG